MDKEIIFKEEQQKLKEVLEIIDEQIKNSDDGFAKEQHHIIGFTEGLRGTQFNRQAMMSMYATEGNRLKSLRNSPYFGRFEFQNKDSGETEIFYIGKKIVTYKNHEVIVYDWRCNQCSMFYDYNIGDPSAHYIESGKKVYGIINGKRQIQIKDGKLISVSDQDTLSDDEILIQYLNENADSRLKSIVATIQKEQNKIIRNSIDNNYIVQGVAGSGKTTVALHRIAYLLYNESKRVDESNFMIIGPNKFFLDYISSALPDLDIDGISQCTFEDIFATNIKGKVKINSKNKELERIMAGELDDSVLKYKSSIKYMKLIEKFVLYYMSSKLNNNIELNDVVLCSKERMRDIVSEYHKNSYKERIDIFIKKMSKIIKEDYENIYYSASRSLMKKLQELDMDAPEREEIILKLNLLRENIKKGCINDLKGFFKFVDTSPILLYYTFIENIEMFTTDNVDLLKKETLKNLDNKQISPSDIAGILLIQHLMRGCKNYLNYSHLIIDEGQDLSIAQYYVLKKIFAKSKFDIFGDINQSIYAYQSINNWDELNKVLFDNDAKLLELNRGYRNTKEIAEISNLVLKSLNQRDANFISRYGNNVIVNNIEGVKNGKFKFQQLIDLINNGHKNIAIICKDNNEVEEVYKELKSLPIDVSKITLDNDKYKNGICILPVYLAKGLEFDAVILNDVSDKKYGENIIEQKLLYVAVTRALHELIIDYNGKISPSLISIDSQKNKQLIKERKY